MKILFISQYFYPETFRGNDIAFDLARRGEQVTVVSAVPNYPQGKFYDGYGLWKKNIEIINGVKIIRVPVVPRGEGNSIQLMLNYFSYATVASLYTVYLALFQKFDLIFVQQLSPVLISVPAIIFKKLQKRPLYTWVLDLWPESLSSAGSIHNKFILNFFNWFTKLEYKNSDKILISSQSFRQSIMEKGNFGDKLIYFPNWAENIFKQTTDIVIPPLPSGFKVMFAGNVGESQDFEHLMQTAHILKDELNIKFIIIGDGRKRKWVEQFVHQYELENTVYIMGRFPLDTMPSFFALADIMLLSLKDELIFNLTVPAKLQTYMAAGKPVVAMLNGEGAAIIKEADCGFSVKAGRYEDLAYQLIRIKNMDELKLNQLGMNGKKYCKLHFDMIKCMDHLCEIMNEKINYKINNL